MNWFREVRPQFGHGFGVVHKNGHGDLVIPIRTFFQFFGGRRWGLFLIRYDEDAQPRQQWQDPQ